jgi:hypothetical protein
MSNKSKNWTDVQLIISSFSIAFTLGFWGLFASHERSGTGVAGEVSFPSQPENVVTTTPVLLPGQKLIFSGITPQSLQISGTTATQPPQIVVTKKKRSSGSGRGGGGGGGVTSTGSSKP